VRTKLISAVLVAVVILPFAGGAAPGGANATSAASVSASDVTFAQMMARHHEQGIAMAQRAERKATTSGIRSLARKQVAEQRRERTQLRAFLRRSEASVTGPAPPNAQRRRNADQLRQLDQATGEEFDRRFLTFQTDHHLGGVMMASFELRTGRARTTLRLARQIKRTQTSETNQMLDRLDVPKD